jgi:hypothetical protein
MAVQTGWRAALKVLNKERNPYLDPEKNTWMAIGYRHGLRIKTDDDPLNSRAFDWSLTELRQHDKVDERLVMLRTQYPLQRRKFVTYGFRVLSLNGSRPHR